MQAANIANSIGFETSKSVYLVIIDIEKKVESKEKQKVLDKLNVLAKSCFNIKEDSEQAKKNVIKGLTTTLANFSPSDLDQIEKRNALAKTIFVSDSVNIFKEAKNLSVARNCIAQKDSQEPAFKHLIEMAGKISFIDYQLALTLLDQASFEKRKWVNMGGYAFSSADYDLTKQMKKLFLLNRERLSEILSYIQNNYPVYSSSCMFILRALTPVKVDIEKENLILNDSEKKQIGDYVIQLLKTIQEPGDYPYSYCDLLDLWMNLQTEHKVEEIFQLISLIPNNEARKQMILHFVEINKEFPIEDLQKYFMKDPEISDAYWSKEALIHAKRGYFISAYEAAMKVSHDRRVSLECKILRKERRIYH